MLEIRDLHVTAEGKSILKGVNLKIAPGEIHAIMGPNGTGKSTLAKVLAGDPSYEITQGDILFEGVSVLELAPEDRAHLGIFLGFQYPVEIPGITNRQFLQAASNAQRKVRGQEPLTEALFEELLKEKMALVSVKEEFKYRSVNGGFSGGEKKKNEVLQMAILNPKLAVLDETDSGLDIDAMRVVAEGVCKILNENNALLLITHYQRLLDYIKPNFIHVMIDGKIVKTGDALLALELEKEGYDSFLTGTLPC